MSSFGNLALAATATALLASSSGVAAFSLYNKRSPNGSYQIGHLNGKNTQFAVDQAAHLDWQTLCMMDSDGDGLTNGQELGDPCCAWRFDSRETPYTSTGLSNPGDPTDAGDNRVPACEMRVRHHDEQHAHCTDLTSCDLCMSKSSQCSWCDDAVTGLAGCVSVLSSCKMTMQNGIPLVHQTCAAGDVPTGVDMCRSVCGATYAGTAEDIAACASGCIHDAAANPLASSLSRQVSALRQCVNKEMRPRELTEDNYDMPSKQTNTSKLIGCTYALVQAIVADRDDPALPISCKDVCWAGTSRNALSQHMCSSMCERSMRHATSAHHVRLCVDHCDTMFSPPTNFHGNRLCVVSCGMSAAMQMHNGEGL